MNADHFWLGFSIMQSDLRIYNMIFVISFCKLLVFYFFYSKEETIFYNVVVKKVKNQVKKISSTLVSNSVFSVLKLFNFFYFIFLFQFFFFLFLIKVYNFIRV